MVDTKCNFPNGKHKKPDSKLNLFNEDESLLRQPLRTSSAGFWEAKKAYENGTDEVRRLLLQECSIIYECNVCRNMFRSLANFISHKQSYCKMKAADSFHSFSDRNTSILIQTIEPPEPRLVKSRSTGSSPIPGARSSSRDLSKVIERLKRVEVTSQSGNNNNNNLAMEYKIKPSSPEPKAPDPVLELEHVPTTAHAVYQTLKTQNDSDSIKTELDEVQNLLTSQKTLLGPDGKAIISSTLTSFLAPTASDNNRLIDNNYKQTNSNSLPGISCEICKIPFQTEKTLRTHVQKKHTSTTYVFQCPTCSMTFMQPAAVIRHLANEHKKPLRRIRKMRDTILKKRIQMGDVLMKGPSRELKRLQLNNTKDFDDTNIVDQQNGKSIITSCMYCWRNFERRAALATHLTNCLARKASLDNKVELPQKFDLSNEQVKEVKIQNKILNQKNDKIKNIEKSEDPFTIKQEPQDEVHSPTKNSDINELFATLGNQTFGNGLQIVSLEKMVEAKENGGREDDKKEKEIKKKNAVKKEMTKRFRIVPTAKQLTCRCKICNKQFNALSNLRRHISMFHYRSRRFGCNLCEYRAFRRYDIVNHLTFVHKMTGEREAMAVEYVTVHEIKYSKDDVEGDIVVVNDESIASGYNNAQEQQQEVFKSQTFTQETTLKTYEKREKRKNILLQSNKVLAQPNKIDAAVTSKDVSHVKVVRRKFKKSLDQKVEGQKRPVRNRIKTVKKDFIYDLLTIKEEPKKQSRLELKRRNTIFDDQNNLKSEELTPPPIKITPYRLRTEPLIPADRNVVKGHVVNVYRKAIRDGLAAPSTLPDLPLERPQMRSRLISSSRSDCNTVPIIETTELEAARLKSTFFDDSFLEKFAKSTNPSFKMKPLLALQHSPLNYILQKFDSTQQNNNHTEEEDIHFLKPPKKVVSSPPNYTIISSLALTDSSLEEKDVTPNGKQIMKLTSPPATPKKRITLMQRLAENRAKRRDSLIRTAFEN